MTTPSRNNDYQAASSPVTFLTRDLWNSVFGDIAARLNDREMLEASFELLQTQGIQASLDYIQATVAPQLESLQDDIAAAQAQIDTIIQDGIAPNSAKLGGQLPAHYATAQALADGLAARVPATRKVAGKALSADVTVTKADVGLGNADNTADADKPVSSATAAALAKKLDNTGPLAGFRNKIINGGFDEDLWQRATSTGPFSGLFTGYGAADRWKLDRGHAGDTTTISRQPFAPGQTDVPGNPKFYHRVVFAGSADASGRVSISQPIEGVQTLAGGVFTRTFYAKADANLNISAEMVQHFGAGGAPSAIITGLTVVKTAIGTGWQKITVAGLLPSIAGKVIGTSGTDALILVLWLSAGANSNSRTNSLGPQSGTIDFARVSIVEGDATAEADPFAPRHPQQELALCQRYLWRGLAGAGFNQFTTGSGQNASWHIPFPVTMRDVPTLSTSGVSVFEYTTFSFAIPTRNGARLLAGGSGGANNAANLGISPAGYLQAESEL